MKRTQISLDDEERALLDAETRRTGRSMSALVRDAVRVVYATSDVEADLHRIDSAFGAWQADEERGDGEAYVEGLRTGSRWDRL